MERKAVIAVLVAVLVVLAAIPIGLAFTNQSSGEKEVVNDLMKVKGIEKNGTVTFKNIPYAEAPVGDLRFKPPVFKEADWTEVRDCTKFGNIAIQSPSYFSEDGKVPEKGKHAANESEDCLNLNIWVPAGAKKGDNLPVYFWIHGGALVQGSGQEDSNDGTAFNRDGVIVVSINYRLGTLGFLSLDSLKKDNDLGTTGNWGLLDQICALKWVNRYIENFGGDPKNITIGGESAGSFSVMNLVLSPLTLNKGLFQKAIMESGALMHVLEASCSYNTAVQVSMNIAHKIDSTLLDDADAIAKLRDTDPYKLMDACDFNGYLYMDHMTSIWSVPDGVALPDNLYNAIKDGKYNDVKMIIGYNFYEGYLFVNEKVTKDDLNDYIDKVFPKTVEKETLHTAEQIKAFFKAQDKKTDYEKMLDLISMTMFKAGVVEVLEQFSSHGSIVFGYEFTHKTNGKIIASHGMEIAYAFGQDHKGDIVFDANDLIVMKAMHQYWVNFIKTGDPNGYGLNTWTPYDPLVGTAMNFATAICSTEHWIDSTTLYFLKDSYIAWKQT